MPQSVLSHMDMRMALTLAHHLGDLQLEDAVLVLRLDLAQVGVAGQAHGPG